MMKRKDWANASLSRRGLFWLGAAILVGGAAVYGVSSLKGTLVAASGCGGAVNTARLMAPLARGEVAAVAVSTAPQHLPELQFRNAAGEPRSLADWRGRVVLVNLWATWCVPCRKEMPTLDALQAALGGKRFDVVAINIDTRDPDKPRAFLDEAGVRHLAYYADPSAKAFQDLKLAGRAFGMPTTFILDPQGCELASLAGPADWASAEALELIRAALPEAAGRS